MTDPFVVALEERATAEGLGVRGLARKLDMSPAMVSRALQGQPVGGKFIARAIRAYPDLEPLVTDVFKRMNESDEENEQNELAAAS